MLKKSEVPDPFQTKWLEDEDVLIYRIEFDWFWNTIVSLKVSTRYEHS